MGRKSLIIAGILIICALRSTSQNAPSGFEFIENKGQWDKSVQFRGELSTGAFFLQQKGFTVLLHNASDLQSLTGHRDHTSLQAPAGKKAKKANNRLDVDPSKDGNAANAVKTLRSHAYQVEFVGANPNSLPIPEKPLATYNNYLIGNDSSKWARYVKIYQAVLYKDVYPNIDIRYYSENSKLKYDLIIHPGGDPRNITLKYTGADKLSIRNNELIIKTSAGEVKELYPYTFQSDNIKGRKEVPCKYVLTGDNTVKFQVGDYSKSAMLIIDPSLIFASFTGSGQDQYGFTATPGPDGSLFSGGIVFGAGFPTTTGAFQEQYQGGSGSRGVDIGIMKFSANGSQRLYATYLGGNNNDYPHSLFSDPQGQLVVMGRSYSTNYPGTKIGPCGNGNIVVTKLNSAGTGIIGSLTIGGNGLDGVNVSDDQVSGIHKPSTLLRNYGDDSRSEVILDGGGNIYVAAQTHSTDFPIVGGAQVNLAGKQDGVVLKINPNCSALTWSTYLGGPEDDGAFVLALNPADGNLYVAGGTISQTFPGTTGGTIASAYNGGETDGFVSILTPGGSLIRSTYIGTANLDIIYGIQFDRIGFPYIMGVSRGGNFGVFNAAYSVANASQFIAKMEPNLSAYIYKTTFGSGSAKPNMSPVAFLVDRCENVYISGWGGWIDDREDPYDIAGVAGMPLSGDAEQSITDNRDFYFTVIEKNASALLYGSYFGQDGGSGEHVDGGTSRYDQQGVIYQAMCANCGGGSSFPTTPGVIAPINGALPGGCNLAAVKISFNFAGVASGPRSFFNNAPDSIGCAPFNVTFRDTVRNALTYIWNFGDGSPELTTTEFEVNHEFAAVGQYRVRLIAEDSTTCNIRDTAFINVYVRNDQAFLGFNTEKLLPCESLAYDFTNTSTLAATARPFAGNSFIWDFGDGVRTPPMGSGSIQHTYTAAGTYIVRLILLDTNYCNAPDSIFQELRVAPLVKAQFETPPGGCAPYDAIFTNTSLAGETFTWDFGDGSPLSNEVNPVHQYNIGTYTITLTAVDPGTCNLRDATTRTLTVTGKPEAAFSVTPVTPEVNKPTVFHNQSTGGVRYTWLFGDGDSTVKTNLDTTMHQYNATGTYNACLIVYNQFGCTDTICQPVGAEILPLLDVPNAFTPGKFGRNSIVKVEGFGIREMTFRIYNRWGQKVYETNNSKAGWDGTFNGQPQPVDVYAYTLDVMFTDGLKTRKTGDITLIR